MRGMPSASITASSGLCWVSWMKAGSTSPMAVAVAAGEDGDGNLGHLAGGFCSVVGLV